jgi:hypothetical protein
MLSVKLESCAKRSRVFVESGLEEAWSEQGAAQGKSAIRSQRLDQGRDIEFRRAQYLERRRRSSALG